MRNAWYTSISYTEIRLVIDRRECHPDLQNLSHLFTSPRTKSLWSVDVWPSHLQYFLNVPHDKTLLLLPLFTTYEPISNVYPCHVTILPKNLNQIVSGFVAAM